jgi:hypothetical protein
MVVAKGGGSGGSGGSGFAGESGLCSQFLLCSLLFSSVLLVRVCPPDASCFRCLLFRRYGLNRFVDLGFIVDMVVNFFMAYLNTRIGVWEFRGHLIVAKYVLSV